MPTAAPGSDRDFEWVNAWAAESGSRDGSARRRPGSREDASATGQSVARLVAVTASPMPARRTQGATGEPAEIERAYRERAQIEQAHDVLRAKLGAVRAPLMQPVPAGLGPRRTGDLVPVVIGGLIGLLMLIVFSAAAMFLKMPR